LADYLVTIGLPSLPALLDATEFARGHSADSVERQLLEEQADALLQGNAATQQDLRELQDQIFTLRRGAPVVPRWFYKLVRPKYEADMRYAAGRAAEASSRATSEPDD